MNKDFPATKALQEALKLDSKHMKFSQKIESSMEGKENLKRSHSVLCSFDMSSFAEASKEIEDSFAFPTLEWPTIDGSQDDEEPYVPLAKRRCHGLSRSHRASFDLTALASERKGSCGSLC